MSRRGLTFTLAGLFVAILAVLASVLPVPYVVLVPGPVTDTLGTVPGKSPGTTTPLVTVRGASTYPANGHIYLTTVGVVPASCDDQPTLLQALKAWFNHNEAVEPEQVICPPGESGSKVQQRNAEDMSNSQTDAITAALTYLDYKPATSEIIAAEVDSDAPAGGVLQAGDAILEVDGQPVTSADRLRALIGAHKPGERVSLTIDRGGSKKDVSVRTMSSQDGTKRTIIGITPDLRATFPKIHVKIGIDPEKVGGPSAGLAFSLGVIDRLTPGDLTGGRTVAVTGTIDGFGHVGPIGGIQQKIAGAKRAGATVFLAPAGECADARAAAPDSMTVVKVDTLETAVEALKAISSGSGSFPRC